MSDLYNARESLLQQLAAVEVRIARESEPVKDGICTAYAATQASQELLIEELEEEIDNLLKTTS